jgi:hypothetical protein
VAEGLYAPTSPDAGANADNRCWVGQRAPVGWMLLCGPGSELANVAPYLRQAANAADNTNVVDFDVRAAMVGRLATRQLAELDRQAPPRAETGVEAARRQMFEEVRRSAQLFTSVSTDLTSLHGTLTQDENTMHLRADALVQRATSEQTRALIGASADRQAPPELVGLLPATVQGYIVGGFDRAQATTALGGEAQPDPRVSVQAGPEVARVLTMVDMLRGMTPLGERIDAYSNEDGYTLYHVIRRSDGQRVLNDLRAAINSLPNRPLPQGGNLRDIATVMPTPGLTGEQYLRVGRNVYVPPGHQLTPDERAEIERSMLVVAESDRLIVITAHDPIARYHGLGQGERLHGTIPANSVMAGHVIPPAFIPLFYGATIPALPQSHTTDAIDFAVHVERRGEGAHAELRADSPIGAAIEIRTLYAMVQELQAQMMQRMAQAAQQAQQQAQQGGGGGGGMSPGGARPRPRLDPSMLPPPPNVQLPAPQ